MMLVEVGEEVEGKDGGVGARRWMSMRMVEELVVVVLLSSAEDEGGLRHNEF